MIITPKILQLRRVYSQDDNRTRINVRSNLNQVVIHKPATSQQKESTHENIEIGFNNDSSKYSSTRHHPSSPIPCPKSQSNDEEAEVEAYLQDFYTRSTWQMYFRIKNSRMAKRINIPDPDL